MLAHSEYMPLQYIKKQKWSGSFQGMRFLLHKVTEKVEHEGEGASEATEQIWLEAVVWKEPFAYETTPPETMTRNRFEFSEEGREKAIAWLEEEYDSRKAEWKAAMRWNGEGK